MRVLNCFLLCVRSFERKSVVLFTLNINSKRITATKKYKSFMSVFYFLMDVCVFKLSLCLVLTGIEFGT